VPWSRDGSGFTLLFEAHVMDLIPAMPVAAAARMVGEHDTRLWRIIHHYVDAARARVDHGGISRSTCCQRLSESVVFRRCRPDCRSSHSFQAIEPMVASEGWAAIHCQGRQPPKAGAEGPPLQWFAVQPQLSSRLIECECATSQTCLTD
jgi:hypothetical protein